MGDSKAGGKSKRPKKRRYCLDGKTIRARNKHKKRRLQRQGAKPGRCPSCQTSSECAAESICADGACKACTVTCTGSAAVCGGELATALAAGGVVYACPGEYAGPFAINSNTSLFGAGSGEDPATNTILDGQGTDSTVTVAEALVVTVQSLAITGGQGAGINAGGGMTIGADGEISVIGCAVYGNTGGGGGGILSGSPLRLANSRVSGNTATAFSGGGVRLNSPVTGTETTTITDSVIASNISLANVMASAGGVFVVGMNLDIVNSEIDENTGFGVGGVLFFSTAGLSVTVDATSRVTDNVANGGVSAVAGGLANDGPGSFTVAGGAVINGNTAPQCVGVTGCP